MTKTFVRHVAELDTGFYGSGFIRGLKMAKNRQSRIEASYSVSRTYGGLKPIEIITLCDRIAAQHPRIEATQAAKGLAYLLDQWHTPRGNDRKNNPFSAREENILRNFDHFELVGWYDVYSDRGHYRNDCFFIPVYRVVSTSGSHFDYYVGSWQSNVPLTIVG